MVLRLADIIGAGRRLISTGSSLYSRALMIHMSSPSRCMISGWMVCRRVLSQRLVMSACSRSVGMARVGKGRLFKLGPPGDRGTFVMEGTVGGGFRVVRHCCPGMALNSECLQACDKV